MKIKLSDVSGISGTPPEDGEVLIWDETLSQYVPGPMTGGGGGGGGGDIEAEPVRLAMRYWRILIAGDAVPGEFMAVGELRWKDEAGVNQVGTGTPLSSADYSGTFSKDKAYDGITGGDNGWISPSGTRATSWLGYDFGVDKDLRSISIAPVDNFKGLGQWPDRFLIQASEDRVTWYTTQVVQTVTPSNGVYQDFAIDEFINPYALGLTGGGGGGGGGIEEAPVDGTPYSRQDEGWVPSPSGGGGGGVEEAPEDGTPYVRQDGAWVPAPTGGGGGGGPVTGTMSQPYVVQVASLRNDGTLALVSPPTPGNVLLFVAGGWGGSLNSGSYFPAGFIYQGRFFSNDNNAVQAGWRLVVSGDTGSYAMSAGDNQFCALFEIAGVGSVVQLGQTIDIRGAAATPAFSMVVPEQYISEADLVFGCVTHDTTQAFTVTPKTGLTVDFVTATLSHGGFIAHWDSTFDSPLTGSITTLTSPVAGFWGVIGKFTPD